MLDFIGTGSAFNTKLGNNSAYIKKERSLLLIDCGGTAFHNLQDLNLLEEVENLYILITHTHPDHVGSLGDLIFYSYHILKNKVKLYFPEEKLIKSFLNNIGVKEEMYELSSKKDAVVEDEYLGKLTFEFVPVTHTDTIPSYGFIMHSNDETIYYSGDSNNIDKAIVEKFIKGDIDYIYQDTCALDYEGNGHLFIGKLCEFIPQQFRSRVYCMHSDTDMKETDITEKGFKIASRN